LGRLFSREELLDLLLESVVGPSYHFALFAPKKAIIDPKIALFFDIISFDISYLVWPD